jgi:hypothetical protein
MPPGRPVWEAQGHANLRHLSRLAGSNAGRLVKRQPLALSAESVPVASQRGMSVGEALPELRQIVEVVIRLMRQRGMT